MSKKKSPATETENGDDVATATREKTDTATPKMYKVLLLNDDYTTMDFVVSILEQVFQKSPAEAVQVMLEVHKAGRGTAGIFAHQIAEAKVHKVHLRAREAGFPLRCQIEEQ